MQGRKADNIRYFSTTLAHQDSLRDFPSRLNGSEGEQRLNFCVLLFSNLQRFAISIQLHDPAIGMSNEQNRSVAPGDDSIGRCYISAKVIDSKDGERGRNRTYNLLIKSQLLCQLSYAPTVGRLVVGQFEIVAFLAVTVSAAPYYIHASTQKICGAAGCMNSGRRTSIRAQLPFSKTGTAAVRLAEVDGSSGGALISKRGPCGLGPLAYFRSQTLRRFAGRRPARWQRF